MPACGFRAAILADARARFGQDIKAALGWAQGLAGSDGLVAASLQEFG